MQGFQSSYRRAIVSKMEQVQFALRWARSINFLVDRQDVLKPICYAISRLFHKKQSKLKLIRWFLSNFELKITSFIHYFLHKKRLCVGEFI